MPATVVGPGQSQVNGQIMGRFEVVAEIGKSVMLTEVQNVVAERDADTAGCISGVRRVVGEVIRAIHIRQKIIRRPLVGVVNSRFELMLADDIVPVVLQLIGINDSPLRRGRCRPVTRKTTRSYGHIRDRILQLLVVRNRVARLLPPNSTFNLP